MGRCLSTSGTRSHVLTSLEDNGCADLLLPTYAITVHNVPICFDQYIYIYIYYGERKCQCSRRQADEGMPDGGAW